MGSSKFTKKERSWIMYDWANSAFILIIATIFMPIFFKDATSSAGISGADSTALWGYSASFCTLILAISSPLIGAFAAYHGMKKKLLGIFVYVGVACTLLMAFIPMDNWKILLGVYMLAFLGFQASIVIYDSFLVDVTGSEKMDKVSSFGFAAGYFGSLITLVICALLILLDPRDDLLMMRISFIITGLWWGIFSIPLLKNVEQRYGVEKEDKAVTKSFKRSFATLRDINKYRDLKLFLISYFFYIDGVNTVIVIATAYAIDIGISANSMLILIIILQLVAIPFPILYQKLAQKIGTKPVLLIGIATYIVTLICMSTPAFHTVGGVFFAATLIGSAQGGVQALSRSTFGKLVPKEKATEHFGFYSIFSKFAAIIGPTLVATVTTLTQNSSVGILSLGILFIIGGAILLFVKIEKMNSQYKGNFKI